MSKGKHEPFIKSNAYPGLPLSRLSMLQRLLIKRNALNMQSYLSNTNHCMKKLRMLGDLCNASGMLCAYYFLE
jgi:hypothetical protein